MYYDPNGHFGKCTGADQAEPDTTLAEGIESGSNTSIAEECNAGATEINSLRGDWESRNVMKAVDNQTGSEVYLVATNAPNQTGPKSLQRVLNDNEIYIGGKHCWKQMD